MDKQRKKLVKKYLNSYGTICPFCNSEDLHTGDIDFGIGQMWQNIKCENCFEEWTDVYTLTGMEPLDK